MKKEKLKLKDLEVQSFVTALKDVEKQTLKEVEGGASVWCWGGGTSNWRAINCPVNSNHADFCTRGVDGCPV